MQASKFTGSSNCHSEFPTVKRLNYESMKGNYFKWKGKTRNGQNESPHVW